MKPLKTFTKLSILSLIVMLGISACFGQKSSEQSQTDSKPKIEGHLLLNNAVLEQANSKGETIWKIKVEKGIYYQEQKKGEILNITGDLLQDNKVVLQIKAKKGEVQDNGHIIKLQEQVTAIDTRNKAIFEGKEIEWQPQKDLLLIKNIQGNHSQWQALAKEGKYYTRSRNLKLDGNVIINGKEPSVQLKTEQIVWEIDQKKFISQPSKPVEMIRYKDKIITDQIVSDRVIVNLKNNTANLENNVQLKSVEPSLQMATNSVIWNYKDRLINANQPIVILNPKEQIKITANQGQVDLIQKVAYLDKGVIAESQKNQARLQANELIWHLPTQNLEAIGNVFYQQNDPEFSATGFRGIGKLQDKSIVVMGNIDNPVITKINLTQSHSD